MFVHLYGLGVEAESACGHSFILYVSFWLLLLRIETSNFLCFYTEYATLYNLPGVMLQNDTREAPTVSRPNSEKLFKNKRHGGLVTFVRCSSKWITSNIHTLLQHRYT